ncbi:MAG TPA: DUF2306 domain-containing protein [Salinarimonas sp.]|nr:DUF2306 domain-containing protein [Salinarimonas sp.]
MSLEPLLSASPAIQLHATAATAAFFVGLAVLARRKGGAAHRRLGRTWVALMAATAISSFGISGPRTPGGWSPIHLLSLATLAVLAYAVAMARRGNMRAHRIAMISLFAGALVITGAFTLMPGRIMHAVLLGTRDGGPGTIPLLAWGLAVAAPLVLRRALRVLAPRPNRPNASRISDRPVSWRARSFDGPAVRPDRRRPGCRGRQEERWSRAPERPYPSACPCPGGAFRLSGRHLTSRW